MTKINKNFAHIINPAFSPIGSPKAPQKDATLIYTTPLRSVLTRSLSNTSLTPLNTPSPKHRVTSVSKTPASGLPMSPLPTKKPVTIPILKKNPFTQPNTEGVASNQPIIPRNECEKKLNKLHHIDISNSPRTKPKTPVDSNPEELLTEAALTDTCPSLPTAEPTTTTKNPVIESATPSTLEKPTEKTTTALPPISKPDKVANTKTTVSEKNPIASLLGVFGKKKDAAVVAFQNSQRTVLDALTHLKLDAIQIAATRNTDCLYEHAVWDRFGRDNKAVTIFEEENIPLLSKNIPVTWLPTNKARNYFIGDEKEPSFTIFSPNPAECKIFIHNQKLNDKEKECIDYLAAVSVIHAASGKRQPVYIDHHKVTKNWEKEIQNMMSKTTKCPNLISIEFFCYCNEMLKKGQKLTTSIIQCERCHDPYHVQCLSEKEKDHKICNACSVRNKIVWSEGNVKNTCPLDNSFQAFSMFIQENQEKHITLKRTQFPQNDAHATFIACMQYINSNEDKKYARVQQRWYDLLFRHHPNALTSYGNDRVYNPENQKNDMYGSALNVAWLPLAAGGTVLYHQNCINQPKCLRTQVPINTSVVSLNQSGIPNVQDVMNILVGGEEKFGHGSICNECLVESLVKSPITLKDSKTTWFLNFEGSSTGLLACDNIEALMKLKDITIENVEFEPRVIVLQQSAVHFTSLIKFHGFWYYFDDMGHVNSQLCLAAPYLYRTARFDHITFFRKQK